MTRPLFTFKRHHQGDLWAGYSVHRGKRQTLCGIVWSLGSHEWYGATGDYNTGRRTTRLQVARALGEMTTLGMRAMRAACARRASVL